MQSFIEKQCEHTSVRSFTSEAVSEQMLDQIMKAAQAASSTCFLQVTSVIRVTDEVLKLTLAQLAGHQKQVAEAPEFWVFCGDYSRNKKLYPSADLGWTEQLIVAAHDAGIMAQNAVVAIEGLGLGACYIGGIRNNIEKVGELLKLPPYCFPVFGLAFGHPKKKNPIKPRLPRKSIFMENEYQPLDEKAILEYDDQMKNYYNSRGENEKDQTWTETLPLYLTKERRPFIKDYLKSKGFAQK